MNNWPGRITRSVLERGGPAPLLRLEARPLQCKTRQQVRPGSFRRQKVLRRPQKAAQDRRTPKRFAKSGGSCHSPEVEYARI